MQHPSEHQFPLALALLMMVVEQPTQSLAAIASRWRLSNEEVRIASAAHTHWPTLVGAHRLPWSTVQPVLIDRDVQSIAQAAAAVVAADRGDERGRPKHWTHRRC